jgi:hypothetical protein
LAQLDLAWLTLTLLVEEEAETAVRHLDAVGTVEEAQGVEAGAGLAEDLEVRAVAGADEAGRSADSI